jgi:hypothetical protein
MPKIIKNTLIVGCEIIEGYVLLANYRNQYVLAESTNPQNPERFVVWALDKDGAPHTGSYRSTLAAAVKVFYERATPECSAEPSPTVDYDAKAQYERILRSLSNSVEQQILGLLSYQFMKDAIAENNEAIVAYNVHALADSILARVAGNFLEVIDKDSLSF